MGEVGRRLRLPPEPLDEGAVHGELGEQDLEGDGPVELAVHGAVHLGHATASDQVGRLVSARIHTRIVDRLHGALSLRWELSRAGHERARHGAPGAVVVVVAAVVVVTAAGTGDEPTFVVVVVVDVVVVVASATRLLT